MPLALVTHFNDMSREEQAKGIEETWTLAEFPARLITPEDWYFMFDHVLEEQGFHLGDDGIIASNDVFPETLTLWRGALPEFREGMSWTDDKEQALWFAHRLDHGDNIGKLYEITVGREIIIGRFNARRENEFVIHADELWEDDVQEVSEESAKSDAG